MAHSIISHFNPNTNFLTQQNSNSVRPTTHYRPKIISMGQTQSYWASIQSNIETYLKQAIPIRSPESVFQPMHQLTFAAPTTTAPALCMAACELVGGNQSQAMAAAAAVHLTHAAAYTHENLPLTDRPNNRPNNVQHKFGPNIELLTGDGIIPFGFELLAQSMDLAQTSPDKIVRVILEISRMAGSHGIIDGLYNELAVNTELVNDYELIEYVCMKKEGELHACGAACGAILGGGTEEEIEKLRKFGMYLGTLKGILKRNRLGMEEKVEKLKGLAMKELESFQGKKIEMISQIVELETSLIASA